MCDLLNLFRVITGDGREYSSPALVVDLTTVVTRLLYIEWAEKGDSATQRLIKKEPEGEELKHNPLKLVIVGARVCSSCAYLQP